MDIRFFQVNRQLVPYVAHIWIVESPGYRAGDIRTIVPNGRAKIVFPFRGTLRNGPLGGSMETNSVHTLWLLGPSDRPSVVDADGAFGVLSLEFHRGAAYRFVPMPIADLTNRVIPFDEGFGVAGRELQERLAQARDDQERVDRLQGFLLDVLNRIVPANLLVDHSMGLIQAKGGLLTVADLAKRLGYTSRHVSNQFDRCVGLGPKSFCEVVRFQNRFLGMDADGYYDQSHAIKEFKRFTGLSPGQYSRSENAFLNRFKRLTSDFYNRGGVDAE